jgi:hypothetical protein
MQEFNMHRCRPRPLNADQYHVLTYALLGDKREPWRNCYHRETDNCTVPEQLVSMGLLKCKWEVPGFRSYAVTQRGADAVGLRLPDE